MKVSGTIAKGKKKNIEQAELAVLFTYCRIKKNVVTVDLNSYIGIIANIEALRLTLKNEEVKPF